MQVGLEPIRTKGGYNACTHRRDFCEIDDFCKEFYQYQTKYVLPNLIRKRNRYCRMSGSEIMTILILFHLSDYHTFKDFYHECVIRLQSVFPRFGKLQ